MKTLEQLQKELDSPIPRSAVKEREGAGKRRFSYLSTDYVIDRNNKVFGNLNWSSNTIENRCVYEGVVKNSYGKEKYSASYIARVQVEVQHIDENGRIMRTSHVGTGYGDGDDASHPGKAHELAAKEAESDALKRACKNLGQSMGLALYDKDQTNVADDEEGNAPAPSAAPAVSNEAGKARPKAESTRAKAPESDRPKLPENERPRAVIDKNIGLLVKIILSKSADRAEALEKLRADLKAKYGVEKREQLSDAQLAELETTLKAQAEARAS